jgi:uncharacterized membrane protein
MAPPRHTPRLPPLNALRAFAWLKQSDPANAKAFADAISSLPDTTREQVRDSVMKFGKSSFNSRFQTP